MNSYINTNNLIKEQNEGDSNLTISCNYNLLNNDNTVRWNGNEITLIKPYGLSNVKKICFRGFKGDLLPFTSIDLPKLKVDVVLTGYKIDNAFLEGADDVYGEYDTYDKTNKNNVLLSFEKAWTYDANEDNQLLYNLKECVEETNRRLKTKYPKTHEILMYNIQEDFNKEWTPRIYKNNVIKGLSNNAGSYLMSVTEDSRQLTLYNIGADGTLTYKVIGSDTGYQIVYAAVSYDKKIINYATENSGGAYYGRMYIMITSSNTVYDNVVNMQICQEYNGFVSTFGLYENTQGSCIGQFGNKTAMFIQPARYSVGPADYTLIIQDSAGDGYYIDISSLSPSKIIMPIACCDAYNSDGSQISGIVYLLTVFIYNTGDTRFRYVLYRLNKNDISTDHANPTKISSYDAMSSYYNLYEDWTNMNRYLTCGKETYKCIVSPDSNGNTFMWFFGSYLIKINSSNIISDVVCIPSYKIGDNRYLSLTIDNYYQEHNGPTYSSFINDCDKYINAGGFNEYDANKIRLNNVGNPLMLFNTRDGSLAGIVQNPNYGENHYDPSWNVFNNEGLPNAVYCGNMPVINLESEKTYQNTTGKMIKNVDNKATTNNLNFFEFKDNGDILTSQINYVTNSALNMCLHVYTDPYYFEFKTPIEYYTNESFSLIHPIVKPVFNTINKHVLNTIETLILLHYEYNNISLVSAQFPNIDGTIFYINEDSYVDFKTMAINSTADGIRVKLLSNNEQLSLTELRALYGKLCVAVDWIQ